MKMSELSVACDLPIPTIKYYLREGLVPAGVHTAANQADYDEGHVHRLRLIRALVEVGELPIATVGAVLAAVDDAQRSTHELLGVVHHALAFGRPPPEADTHDGVVVEIQQFLANLGWQVSHHAPATHELARVLTMLRCLGWNVGAEVFAHYARAADQLAAWELEQIGHQESRPRAVEGVVVGTVLFEAALVALRRLAEEHHSSLRFAPGGASSPGTEPVG